MDPPAYDDFEVVLERVAGGTTARVTSSPVGPTPPVPVEMPSVDVDGLRELVRLMNDTRGVVRHEARVTPDLRHFGSALFDAVFRGAVLRSFRDSLAAQSGAGRGLRLRVRLTDVPELAHLPWEVLYDAERHRFPSQYAKYPTVRQVDVPEAVAPLAVDGGVRMLVVTASPTDLPDIDGDQEWRCLEAALRPHIASGRLVVTRLPVATLDAVREALLAETYHVFHFTGHGGVDAAGEGILAFTDRFGRAMWVPGRDLGVILSNAPVRLALLNSCDGARVSEADPYATTAITLVENGIPAVVAMQFEISDKAAIAFSNATYLALSSSQPVDVAVTLARQAILTTSRNEWATPVLYLRAADGTLFAWDRDLADETSPRGGVECSAPAADRAPGLSGSRGPGPHVGPRRGRFRGRLRGLPRRCPGRADGRADVPRCRAWANRPSTFRHTASSPSTSSAGAPRPRLRSGRPWSPRRCGPSAAASVRRWWSAPCWWCWSASSPGWPRPSSGHRTPPRPHRRRARRPVARPTADDDERDVVRTGRLGGDAAPGGPGRGGRVRSAS